MSKIEKLISKILEGKSDNNIEFSDLKNVLKHFGFIERTKGSHHNYRKEEISEPVNIQEEKGKAKNYQIKQVRKNINKYFRK